MQGVDAVDALLSATPETPSYMIGIVENKITRVPLVEAVQLVGLTVDHLFMYYTNLWIGYKTQAVATAIEAKDFEKAMSLRDPEFADSFNNFITGSVLGTANLLPAPKVKFL